MLLSTDVGKHQKNSGNLLNQNFQHILNMLTAMYGKAHTVCLKKTGTSSTNGAGETGWLLRDFN